MAETFPHDDPFRLQSTAPKTQETGQVIKHGETFAILDRFGDVLPVGVSQHGIFHRGTRYVSRLALSLANDRPVHLSSTVHPECGLITLDMMNPQVMQGDDVVMPAGTVHLLRSILLWKSTCHQRIELQHYGVIPVTVPLHFDFDGDFVDIFEVRGTRPIRRGHLERRLSRPDGRPGCDLEFCYRGADTVVRRTRICFSQLPDRLSERSADLVVRLQPGDRYTLDLRLALVEEPATDECLDYVTALEQAQQSGRQTTTRACRFSTDSHALQDLLDRSLGDLQMMLTETEHGPYPYAGVPWFSCPFGRDGIITALQCLWVYPEVARGTLRFLAATQATAFEPDRDAEPGKILHEARKGEMANLNEIPFGRYYGSVDATPLFVYLAGQYFRYSHDEAFLQQLWPSIEAALLWMERYADTDGDGFIEYEKKTANGLANQGWKDSADSISHADGTLATAPIALCEVQAYAYGAWVEAAHMLSALGRPQAARPYRERAAALARKFDAAFWQDDLGTYALALDADKKPCRVRSSNAGHCLTMGIAQPPRAARLASMLLSPEMYSGWGVRTLAAGEVRYNPMSYHNGSVWPHDNALIALGLARYGFKSEASRILSGLVEASAFFELHRLPELMSGFSRRVGQGPTRYPVACSPQAWSVGAPFMLLAACLGLTWEKPDELLLRHPSSPEFLHRLQIEALRGCRGTVDLDFHRHGEELGITVVRKTGSMDVVVIK